MNDRGYKQAIENVAYEIELITDDICDARGGNAEKVVSFFAKGDAYMMVKDRMRALDDVIDTICETYHRTDAEFMKDLDLALAENTKKLGEI